MNDLSQTNVEISLETFKNIKARVDKYLKDGGDIKENRHIPLEYPGKSDYITYTVYKDMLNRYNTFVEKNKREPNHIVICKVKTFDNPAGKTFSTPAMNLAAQQIQASIAANRGLPATVNIESRDGNIYTFTKGMYAGLFESRNVFIRVHGRYPTYVTYNTNANNPVVAFYQSTMYTCCPRSLANAIMACYGGCGGVLFEKKCAQALGTHYDERGTDEDNIPLGAKKLGYTAKLIKRNFDSVKNSLDLGKPVLAHIQTGGSTKPKCLKYKNDYGHYILIYDYSGNNYKVLDPTKGFKTCSETEINKATKGRDINYYSISP